MEDDREDDILVRVELSQEIMAHYARRAEAAAERSKSSSSTSLRSIVDYACLIPALLKPCTSLDSRGGG
jgi:hypothetical protein